MVTISLCMIVRDEADTIANCLASVKDIVDEIIIVDTGSTDQTKEIVGHYTDLIFDFQWNDDFAAARNFAFSQATKEYIFWFDADDVLLARDRQKLIHLKETLDSTVDSVTMIYHYAFDQYGNPTKSFRRNRLVKRSKQFQWIGPVHEYLAVNGHIINSEIIITHKRTQHHSGRNLAIFEKRLANGESFSPRDLYYYANELYDHQFFEKAIDYYQRFLSIKQGWVEDKISACNKLADMYYQLGDLEKEREYIFKSFNYDTPRAEFCCRLGYQFLHRQDIKQAVFWYKLATQLDRPKDSWGFFHEPCWTWLPHLQLCVCYYQLAEYKLAYKHNEIARTFRPSDENILHNKNVLEKQLNISKQIYHSPTFQGNVQQKPLSSNGKNKLAVPTINRPLKIIQVAPDVYPVPPKKYGGIERVVYDLTEELVQAGHEVYLYAPHGSETSAKLIPYPHQGPNPNNIAEFVLKTLPAHIDVIHDHTHAAMIARSNLTIPTLYSNHGGSKNEVKYPVYVSKRTLEVVGGNQGDYVYNGIDVEAYQFSEQKEDYLLFIGVLYWHKGIHYALDIAERTQQKMVIAGPIHHPEYFQKDIEPYLLRNPNITYVGEVGGIGRQNLLKHAKCLVFPTNWEEPFGLVMIEAMACGTPVIALANGAVPEVLRGFPHLICHSVDEMVEKIIHQVPPSPPLLRQYVLNHFTRKKMAERYLQLYEKLMSESV